MSHLQTWVLCNFTIPGTDPCRAPWQTPPPFPHSPAPFDHSCPPEPCHPAFLQPISFLHLANVPATFLHSSHGLVWSISGTWWVSVPQGLCLLWSESRGPRDPHSHFQLQLLPPATYIISKTLVRGYHLHKKNMLRAKCPLTLMYFIHINTPFIDLYIMRWLSLQKNSRHPRSCTGSQYNACVKLYTYRQLEHFYHKTQKNPSKTSA